MGIFTWGAAVGERQADRMVLDSALTARVEALEQSALVASKVRSIGITTEKLEVYVYPVENVGVVKP